MWIRSAFWVGCPRSGFELAFDQAIEGELIPGLGALPGVERARVLWPRKREDNPPDFYCQVIVEFPDRAAMDTMLASPGRVAMRSRVLEVATLFGGHLSHIDFEVGKVPHTPSQSTGEIA